MPTTMQPSFAGGEISPSLYGRVDLARYAVSARTLKNMIVHPHGGVSKRPGTKYIYTVPVTASNKPPVRLIPFQFSTEQAYVLEFTDFKMRIIKDGGLVTDADIYDIVEIVSPYAGADMAQLRYTQSADTMFFAHPSYPPYKLTRSSHTAWTFEEQTFTPALQAPSGVTAVLSATVSSASPRTVIYRVSAINENGDESYPSDAVSVTIDSPWVSGKIVTIGWSPVTGAYTYNVYKNSRGFYGLIGTLGLDFAKCQDGPSAAALGGGASGHEATYLFDSNNATYWQSTQTGTGVNAAAFVGRDFGTSTTRAVAKVRIRNGLSSNTSRAISSTKLQYSSNGSSWTTLQTFTMVTGKAVWSDLLVTATPVASRYWRLLANANMPSGDTWIVEELEFYEVGISTTFIDDNIDPNGEFGPQQHNNPFDGTGTYPGCVSLFQQRLMFARSDKKPQTVWGTRTGGLNNMGTSQPLRDDDSMEVAIASGTVDEVRHMVPMRTLLLFTAGSEWEMAPGSQADALSPLSVRFNVGGYYGCSDVAPITVGDSVLFIQRDGRTVRDLFYQLSSDGYKGTNLGVWAKHLFEGKAIVSWAYQQHPDSILWVVLDDGTLLSFTYMQEHQVFAWSQHDMGGEVKSVAVIPGDSSDEVYFVISRLLGKGGVYTGSLIYCLEQLAGALESDDVEDAFHVDCGASYDGTATSWVTGLYWLGNMDVVALADGAVVAGTVDSVGSLTLPNGMTASKIHIGLPFTADLETLSINLLDTNGRRKRVSRLTASLLRTGACYAGPDAANLTPLKFRTTEVWGDPTSLFSGDKELVITPKWTRDGKVLIRSTDPLPMTVLAVMPEVEVGD